MYIYIYMYKFMGYYTSILLPLLLIPSWALAIDPFSSLPPDGRSLITLSQPQGGSERSERS